GGPDAGGANDTVKGAKSLGHAVDAALHVIAARHVGAHKLGGASQPLGVSASGRFTDVGDDDTTTGSNDQFRRRCAKSRRATAHKDGASVQLHRAILSRPVHEK